MFRLELPLANDLSVTADEAWLVEYLNAVEQFSFVEKRSPPVVLWLALGSNCLAPPIISAQ